MKADWEEILDMWEEKELAHFLPECLPDMDLSLIHISEPTRP